MAGQQGSRARWLVLAAVFAALAASRVQNAARHSPSFVKIADGAYRRGASAGPPPPPPLAPAACRLPRKGHTAALAPRRLTQHWYLVPGLSLPIPVSVGLVRGDKGWVRVPNAFTYSFARRRSGGACAARSRLQASGQHGA